MINLTDDERAIVAEALGLAIMALRGSVYAGHDLAEPARFEARVAEYLRLAKLFEIRTSPGLVRG